MQAGVLPVEARQTRARYDVTHARHIVRLLRRFEMVQLWDAIPEAVFLNSHDGTSAYLMWMSRCHHPRQSVENPAVRASTYNLWIGVHTMVKPARNSPKFRRGIPYLAAPYRDQFSLKMLYMELPLSIPSAL